MRRLQPYALLVVFAVLGFYFGGPLGLLTGIVVWGIVDQVRRRRAGNWSPRRFPWQRTLR